MHPHLPRKTTAALLLLFPTLIFSQWEPLTNHGATADINVVWAIDELKVFAVSDDYLLRTTDGGQSWHRQELSTLPFAFNPEGIHFFDALHGIIIGDRLGGLAQSFTTHDGGESWTEATVAGPGPIQIEDVRMVSPTEAYIIGTQGFMAKTTDGGQSWSELQVPGGYYNWLDMAFFDPLHGIVLNRIGQLFRTSDGGASWQLSTTPAQSEFALMQFFDAANGYLNDPYAGFFRTTDGGQTWELVTQAITGPGGVFFFTSPSTGWTALSGTIFRTTDGGLTFWLQYNSPDPTTFRDMHFAGNTGWLCGNDGAGRGLLFKAVNNGGFGIRVDSYPGNVMCSFETNTFTCLHDGATEVLWFVDDVDQGINSPVFVFQPPADGTYGIYCLARNASQSLRSFTIYQPVSTDPILPFGGTLTQDSICRGASTTIVMSDVYQGPQYSIQAGGRLLHQFTGTGNAVYNWSTGPLDSTTTFDLYVAFTLCGGWKKMDSLTVHVVEPPDATKAFQLPLATVCENVPLEIQVIHPQPGIRYQAWAYDQPWGEAQSGNGDTLTIFSNALSSTVLIGVRAAAGGQCGILLPDPVWVDVVQINPTFAVSTQYTGIGDPVYLENTSPDSLSIEWSFYSLPPGSPDVPGSNDPQPQPVIFTREGTGYIQLTGISPGGCRDSLVVGVEVSDLSNLSADWAMPQLTPGQQFMEMDPLGHLYGYANTGKAQLSSRLGAGAEVSNHSGFLYKYDRRGILQWYNTFDDFDGIPSSGAAVRDLITDEDGNSTVLFSLNNVNDLFLLSSADGRNLFVQKTNCLAIAQYSPNGVLHWVRFVEPVNTAAGGIRYNSFWSTSMGMDTLGNIFLLAHITNSQYPDRLYSTTPDGPVDTITIAPQTFSNFVIKIRPDGRFAWLKDHVSSTQVASNTVFHRGAILKPDGAGGCYLWSNGTSNTPYATELLRLDEQGATTWKKVWWLSISVTNSNYIWANDMQLGPNGSVYLLGSCSAPHVFGTGDYFGTFPGTYLVKLSPAGVTQWARSVTKSYVLNPSNNHHALGMALDDDRVHVLTEFSTPVLSTILDPHCVDTSFTIEPTLCWTTWDTLGNLLQIRPAAISMGGQNTPSAVSRRVQALNGQLFVLGKTYAAGGGSFWGLSLPPNDLSGKGFLAAVTDPQSYLPYLNQCSLERCERDTLPNLRISPLFRDIRWFHNDTLLEGYDQPAIAPPLPGTYRASGVNPNGNSWISPVPASVTLAPFPEATITQVDAGLSVPFYPDVIYLWYDSLGTLLSSGWDINLFRPETAGWYRVEIQGTGTCRATSDLFYFDGVVPTEEAIRQTITVRMAPNPTTGRLNLDWTGTALKNGLVQLSGILGQPLRNWPIPEGAMRLEIQLDDLPPGVYVVKMSAEGRPVALKKVLKQ